jgi:hypothetical protein
LNLGIHDQTVALQWVQENIHFFGGDKAKAHNPSFEADYNPNEGYYFSRLRWPAPALEPS